MAASVSNTPVAVAVRIEVLRAFVRMRHWMLSREDLARRLDALERKFAGHDEHIAAIFEALRALVQPEAERARKGRIGFERPALEP